MSKMRIAGKMFGLVCFVAAIVDLGIGIHAVDKHNATASHYYERQTMYDGPSMPVEFLFLGVGVIAFKAGDPDWNKEEDTK